MCTYNEHEMVYMKLIFINLLLQWSFCEEKFDIKRCYLSSNIEKPHISFSVGCEVTTPFKTCKIFRNVNEYCEFTILGNNTWPNKGVGKVKCNNEDISSQVAFSIHQRKNHCGSQIRKVTNKGILLMI